MAFSGYLLKINKPGSSGTDYTFPHEYIAFESFKVVRGVQDLDAYRDGNGVLHRNALPHTIAKVEFQLRENVKSSEYESIMQEITSRYTKSEERKVNVTCFIPELATYTTQDMYLPDPEVVIKKIDGNELVYKSIRFAFIEY